MPSKVKFKPRNFMRVLNYIKKHPKEWDQGRWYGTACCFAGTAAWMGGAKTAREDRPRITVDGVLTRACHFLGLPNSVETANDLFEYRRTISDFEQFYRERVKSDAKGKAAPPFTEFEVTISHRLRANGYTVEVQPSGISAKESEAQRSFIESAIQEALGGRAQVLYDELQRVKWLLSDAEREVVNKVLDIYVGPLPAAPREEEEREG